MIRAGTVLDGKYQIWEKIGSGGMGTVYKAQHLTLDRPVAIKFLHPEYSRNDEHKARFIREAKVSSRLIHEHAITIHDFGINEDQMYIVMELLTGQPLHRLVGRGKNLEHKRACQIAWQIAEVLIAAHELSIVHRDLKPENVMIEVRADGTEHAIVVDFGLAFLTDTDESSMARLTKEGIIAGTPAFLSPEQGKGTTLTTASDIYSFACILHEMFTGSNVFLGKTAIELVNQHVFVPARSPRDSYPDAEVSVAVDAIIMKMLQKDPEARPSAIEVRDWFAQILGNQSPRDRGRPESLLGPRKDRSVTQVRIRPDALTPPVVIGSSAKNIPADATIGILTDEIEPTWLVSLATAKFYCDAINVEAAANYRVVVADRCDLKVIEEITKVTTVIAVTQSSEIQEVTDLLKAGAFDVISHPFEFSDLVKKVERAWRKKKRS